MTKLFSLWHNLSRGFLFRRGYTNGLLHPPCLWVNVQEVFASPDNLGITLWLEVPVVPACVFEVYQFVVERCFCIGYSYVHTSWSCTDSFIFLLQTCWFLCLCLKTSVLRCLGKSAFFFYIKCSILLIPGVRVHNLCCFSFFIDYLERYVHLKNISAGYLCTVMFTLNQIGRSFKFYIKNSVKIK